MKNLLLILCAVFATTACKKNPVANTQVTPASIETDTNKASLDGQNTRTVSLEVRGGEVPLSFYDGSANFKALTADPKSVLQARWQKPASNASQEAKLIFDLTISAVKKKTQIRRTLPDIDIASDVASLLNIASTSSLHVIANAEKGPANKGILRIIATDVTNEDLATVERSGLDVVLDAADSANLGEKNFRGAYQEIQIRGIDIPEELIDRTNGEQMGLVYFQEGKIKKSPDAMRATNPVVGISFPELDKGKNYCYIRFQTSAENKSAQGFILAGNMTLIPIYGDATTIGTSNKPRSGSIFSYRRSGVYTGKNAAFNKAGNGAADSQLLFDLSCELKGNGTLKVRDLREAFGADAAKVVYRAQNKVDTYFDMHSGLEKPLRNEH